MGGGGTGKSVLSAVLLDRMSDRLAACHFCRHDNAEQSAPISLLRSLAAMLCATLPGFRAALHTREAEIDKALVSTDLKLVFETLLSGPLREVPAPEKVMFVMIDALDELPKKEQKPVRSRTKA